jgi:hypothetical protein
VDIDKTMNKQKIKAEGGLWISMNMACPKDAKDEDLSKNWKGLDLIWSKNINLDENLRKEKEFGNWIVYDIEKVDWWNNKTSSRSIELRGFVYSALTDKKALSSDLPSTNILVDSPGAKLLDVSFITKTTKDKTEGSTNVRILKSKRTMCNMGHQDSSENSEYRKCDRGVGLICEKCDTSNGYMQECVNPKGSRCRLCASCAPGYKRAGQARCKKCPDVTTNRILLAVGILAMILGASVLIYMAIEAADAADNISDAMKKIIINYLQVTSLAAGFPLKWPEPVESMFAAMSAISSAGQHILSPDCELSWMEPAEAFYSKQVGFAGLPLLIFLASKIIWTIIIPFYHHCTKVDPSTLKAHEEPIRRSPSYYLDRTILTDIVFFYFLYPTQVKQAIAMFACNKIGSKWYLSADLQEVCLEGRHLWWMTTLGFAQIGAYVVGLPLLGFVLLAKNRYKLHQRQIRFRYGLLYAGYRRKTFWWECVIALRKVMFVVIAGVFGSRMGPDLQCFVALFVLFWFFNFHLSAHPFDEITSRHRVLHHMEAWAMICGWCTMWMGLIFYLGNEFGRIDRYVMTVFTVAIIGMNSVYLIVVFVLFFKEFIVEKMEAKQAHEHEKMVHKLAAQLHAEQFSRGESAHDAKGGVMIDAAASLLKWSAADTSKGKLKKKTAEMKRRLTKKAMTDEQMERMETMMHTQRAFDSIVRSTESTLKRMRALKSEQEYQKGRMARRLLKRREEKKLGIQSNRVPTPKSLTKRTKSLFSKRLDGKLRKQRSINTSIFSTCCFV